MKIRSLLTCISNAICLLLFAAGCKVKHTHTDTRSSQVSAATDCTLVAISEQQIAAIPATIQTDSLQIVAGNGINGASKGLYVPETVIERGKRGTLEATVSPKGKINITCECDSIKRELISLQSRYLQDHATLQAHKTNQNTDTKSTTATFTGYIIWALLLIIVLAALFFYLRKRITSFFN